MRSPSPNSYTLDDDALPHNLGVLRAMAGDGVKVFQVCKGDGYGLGLERVVGWGLKAGVDGFCVGRPDEAVRVRAAAPAASVLLFTSTLPASLADLARAGITTTANSIDALQAILAAGYGDFYFEVDCGFGRFGIPRSDWDACLSAYAAQSVVRCSGLYTHFGSANPITLDKGLPRFEAFLERMRGQVRHPFETMVAASNVSLAHPALPFTAIDPGRALYGLIEDQQMPADRLRPALAGVFSGLIQITRFPEEETINIAYGGSKRLPAGAVLGVFPIGWLDGLSARPPYGEVLVGGVVAPVMARTLQHSIVDLTACPNPTLGDAVTLVNADLPLERAATAQGLSMTELHFTLGRALVSSASAA